MANNVNIDDMIDARQQAQPGFKKANPSVGKDVYAEKLQASEDVPEEKKAEAEQKITEDEVDKGGEPRNIHLNRGDIATMAADEEAMLEYLDKEYRGASPKEANEAATQAGAKKYGEVLNAPSTAMMAAKEKAYATEEDGMADEITAGLVDAMRDGVDSINKPGAMGGTAGRAKGVAADVKGMLKHGPLGDKYPEQRKILEDEEHKKIMELLKKKFLEEHGGDTTPSPEPKPVPKPEPVPEPTGDEEKKNKREQKTPAPGKGKKQRVPPSKMNKEVMEDRATKFNDRHMFKSEGTDIDSMIFANQFAKSPEYWIDSYKAANAKPKDLFVAGADAFDATNVKKPSMEAAKEAFAPHLGMGKVADASYTPADKVIVHTRADPLKPYDKVTNDRTSMITMPGARVLQRQRDDAQTDKFFGTKIGERKPVQTPAQQPVVDEEGNKLDEDLE